MLAVERYRAHRAVIELLARLAATRPLVLTLDDMHDADPALARAAASRCSGARPPRGCWWRSRAIATRRAAAPRAQRDGSSSGSTSARWTPDDALAADRRATLPAAQREAVLRESGGNPFYLEQLVRAGAAQLPASVAEAIAGELRALDDRRAAAAGGRGGGGRPVRARPGRGGRRSSTTALELLDGLLAAGLVRETSRAARSSRSATRSCAARSTRARAAAGGSPRTRAWRRRWRARGARAGAARATTSSSRPRTATRAPIALLRAAGDAVLPADARDRRALVRGGAAAAPRAERRRRRAAARGPRAAPSPPPGAWRRAGARCWRRSCSRPTAAPEHVRLVAGCAAVEHWLGRHDDARRRLHSALDRASATRRRCGSSWPSTRSTGSTSRRAPSSAARGARRARPARDAPRRRRCCALVRAADGQRAQAEQALDAALAATARSATTSSPRGWRRSGTSPGRRRSWTATTPRWSTAAAAWSSRRATGQDRLSCRSRSRSSSRWRCRAASARRARRARRPSTRRGCRGNHHHLAWALWEYGLDAAGTAATSRARGPRWRRAARWPTRPGATCSGSPSPAGR